MQALLIVLLTAAAVSFGWGMRGALIGGEKGAMLPGAMLGICFACFSGSEVLRENFWIPAAVGSLAMGYGGFEPYAQTMSFILRRPSEKLRSKGYAGLSLKGALWFGIASGFLGISASALSGGVYAPWQLAVFCLLIPLMQALGVRIFNKPYDKSAGIFPKIYFSTSSREEWGGNLVMLISMLVFMGARRDFYSLGFSAVGMLSGAVGWCIGIKLMDVTSHPLKSGRYFFGSLQKDGLIDNWKIMEFTLGAVGGGGSALYFSLAPLPHIGEISSATARYDTMLAWASVALILLTLLQYIFVARAKKLSDGKSDIDTHVFELLERPLIFVIPLLFALLGNIASARISAVFALYFVAAEELCFESFSDFKGRGFLRLLLAAGGVATLCALAITPERFTLFGTLIFYFAVYEIGELLNCLRPKKLAEAKKKSGSTLKSLGSVITVHANFLALIAVILTAFGVIF